jgi:hypothetical protein
VQQNKRERRKEMANPLTGDSNIKEVPAVFGENTAVGGEGYPWYEQSWERGDWYIRKWYRHLGRQQKL